MKYSDFTKQFKRSDVIESTRSYRHLIEKLENGKVLIDGIETDFYTVNEARLHVKQEHAAHKLEERAAKQLYEELSDKTIANIINQHHNIRVTDTLVESYKELASSHMFSVDPVVHKIRLINKLDRLIENKLHYHLKDGAIVAISEQTQERLNNLLQSQPDIIDYMREDKNNFMYVISKLQEN